MALAGSTAGYKTSRDTSPAYAPPSEPSYQPYSGVGSTEPDIAPILIGILVLTARGEVEEAARVCEHALSEYPDNLGLLAVKSRLEEKLEGGEKALATAKTMLHLLRDIGDNVAGAGNSFKCDV